MNHTLGKLGRVSLLGSIVLLPAHLFAQDSDEPAFELSPFEVTSAGSIGYQARDTLAGTRLRTDLRDVANAVQVINQQFLQDTGATDSQSLLQYTTNTEVGGLAGNFSGVGDAASPDDNSARTNPQSNTRVRGLDSADNTRNFFLTEIPWNGYNVERVDIQRGANAVLFGIGSPAGIINADLIRAQYYNRGKIEFRYGSHGSVRANFDVNQQIIEDELAIRVAGVHDHTKYKQDPAYQKDRRLYLTARWDPSFLSNDWVSTTINVTGETGSIRANRPRILPPEDRITPWFNELGQMTVDPRIVNGSSFLEYERLGFPSSYGVTERIFTNSANVGQANPNYSPWINRFAPIFGPVAIFNDPNSAQHDPMISQVQGVEFATPRPAPAPPPAPSLPFTQWVGVTSYSDYGVRADLPGSSIGAIKNRSLTDRNIFDFYNNLLDGSTKYENDDFNAYNIAISQSFLQNMFGLEFVYDSQSVKRENIQTLAEDGYAIYVDMQEYLYYSDHGRDALLSPGIANPNVGRPFVAARGRNGNRQEIDSESFRVTAFTNLDFKEILDRDDALTRLIGRHVITGLYTQNQRRQDNFSWYHSEVGDDYLERRLVGGASFGSGERQVATLSYLGGDMRGLTPDQVSLSRINAPRVVQSGTTQLFDWTIADQDVPRNPVDLSRYVGYREAELPVLHSQSGDRLRLMNPSGTNMEKVVTSSKVLVWQGFLLNGIVVPTVSWREDTQTSARSGASPIASRAANNDGALIFTDPDWYVPSGPGDVGANRTWNRVKDDNVSWGVVVHAPEFVTRHLPYGLNLSVFYNDSSNFRPDASRVDLFGRPVPSPIGSTKDYGFTLSALNDRYVLKVNWYESEVQNANLAGAIENNYIVGFGEAWGYQFARMAQESIRQGEAGQDVSIAAWNTNYALVEEENPADPDGPPILVDYLPGRYLAYEPMPGQTFEEAYAEQQLAIDTLLANPPPQEFKDAWGFDFESWEAGPRDSFVSPTGLTGNLAVLSTNRSEGVEVEFSAQITPNWNLTFNVARTKAIRDDIADNYAVWVEDRFQLYQGPAGDVRMWNGSASNAVGETVRAKFTREFYGNYMQQRQLQGSVIPENRKYRFNVVTNYSFNEGALRGFNVGGAYRWQDRQVIAYPVLPDPITEWSYDINNPIMSPTESDFDFWVGYTRPINEKIDWRIQLNVRNAFSSNKLIPVSAQPDGSPGIFRIKEGMTWFVTNTFSF